MEDVRPPSTTRPALREKARDPDILKQAMHQADAKTSATNNTSAQTALVYMEYQRNVLLTVDEDLKRLSAQHDFVAAQIADRKLVRSMAKQAIDICEQNEKGIPATEYNTKDEDYLKAAERSISLADDARLAT